MGDLDHDTAVEDLGGGRYRASLSADWEIWGPCGGYVAAVALRAAGAASRQARPASFYCHYFSVAAFGPVEVEVVALRSGRTVTAQRVSLTQGGTPVLEAMVWSVGDVEGLEHHDERPPEVPGPGRAPAAAIRPQRHDSGRRGAPRFAFWDNFDQRSPEDGPWPPTGPLPPTWRTWVRYRPTPTFDDPWLDAARSLVVLDVGSWPSGSRPHAYRDPGLHRTEPRPPRRLPRSRPPVGVAPARRALPSGAGRHVGVDGPRLVRGSPTPGQRGRTGPVPPNRMKRCVNRNRRRHPEGDGSG